MAVPKTYAQDILLCDLCENSSVCLHCKECKINLCKSCVGQHVTSGRMHTVVIYQIRKKANYMTKCRLHEGQICELYCTNCSTPICVTCTAKEHASHIVMHLQTVVDMKEKEIKSDISTLGFELQARYRRAEKDILAKMSNLSSIYDPLIQSIETQEQNTIGAVKTVAADFKDQVNEHRQQHENILRAKLNDIDVRLSQMDKQVQINARVLDSKQIDEKLQYTSRVKSEFPFPKTPQITAIEFKPNKVNISRLYNDFGSFVKMKQGNVKNILTEVKIVSSFNSSILALTTLNNAVCEKIWAAGMAGCLVCLDLSGNVLERYVVDNKTKPFDLTVTSNNEVIYTLWKQKCIKMITEFRTEIKLHQFDWGPKGICCTASGDILVCLKNPHQNESKIVRLNKTELKREFHKDSGGKALFKDASFLTENINGDICVSDKEDQSVIVITRTGKLRFKYKTVMDPHTVVSDSRGNILILDSRNNTIHVIDEDGQFLTSFDEMLSVYHYTICVDEDDRLYLGEYETGDVTIIKYLN